MDPEDCDLVSRLFTKLHNFMALVGGEVGPGWRKHVTGGMYLKGVACPSTLLPGKEPLMTCSSPTAMMFCLATDPQEWGQLTTDRNL